MTLAGCPSGRAYADTRRAEIQLLKEAEKLRALNAELLTACRVMMDQLEDAMAGEVNERGQRWVTGKTDLQLRPDGSYMLSHVRAVLAKAEAH